MRPSPSRRTFLRNTTAISLASLLPKGLLAADSKTERVTIHTADSIGIVRPEFHGHFAEHLGSCVYGGLWVGKNSPIPNVDGYRKAAVDYLKALGVPVLRWPGGCFADDYHWRDGIGSQDVPSASTCTGANTSKTNQPGLHEFIGLLQKKSAPSPTSPAMSAAALLWNCATGSNIATTPPAAVFLMKERRMVRTEPFNVRYWGVGNEN